MKWFIGFICCLVLIFSACNRKKEKPVEKEKKATENVQDKSSGWEDVVASIVKIESYDNNRILETGQAFFITENLIATRFSLISKANKAFITPFNETKKYQVMGYVAMDRINDMVILEVDGITRKPISLFTKDAPVSAKSYYITRPQSNTIPLRTGKILSLSTIKGGRLYRVTNQITKSSFGTPVFVSNKQTIGIGYSETVDYELQALVIPSKYIAELLHKKSPVAKSLESLSTISNSAIAKENSQIKGLLIETDMGDFKIKLYNETAEYRDNFIKLTKEHYFDSLLIHRVIEGFGIQSGAADTRYASKNDVVGWKGPGYTIPAHIVPKYFHKRAVIGSPRKPDTKNTKRRSDGSQFYIVSGRKYTDLELNDLEESNNYTYSKEQRNTYKTIGGSPHLDGSYTVFGEVISGMDVVDRISKVGVDNDFRPLNDIRIKKISIIK